MATLGGLGLALQVVHNFFGMVLNMRDNAASIKARAQAQSQPAASLAAEFLANADAYEARIRLVTAAVTRSLQAVTDALGELGLTVNHVNTVKNGLQAMCDHNQAADLSSYGAIIAECDYVASNAPNWERIY